MSGTRRWLVGLAWLWLGVLPVANQAALAHGHGLGPEGTALEDSAPAPPGGSVTLEPCPLCRAQNGTDAAPPDPQGILAPLAAGTRPLAVPEPRPRPATQIGARGPRAPPFAS